jgi:hypothetical protein
MLLLTLVVGQVADLFNRKTIISICQAVESSTLALLTISSYLHRLHPAAIYCAVAPIGATRGFLRTTPWSRFGRARTGHTRALERPIVRQLALLDLT